jgi:hypothetical protein
MDQEGRLYGGGGSEYPGNPKANPGYYDMRKVNLYAPGHPNPANDPSQNPVPTPMPGTRTNAGPGATH